MSVTVVPEAPSGLPPVHAAVSPRGFGGRVAVWLCSLVVLAAALRVEGIGTWYWIDEALSVGIARHDLLDIPSLLLRDGSPPLWYLLLHVWTDAFGSSATATHALSLVFGVATVPVAWFVGRRLSGDGAGWLAAALAAVSPFVTYFSRETRMYSLVVVLTLIVAGSFIAAFVDGAPRARWVFVASLVALLYTHNWGLYTGLACALALLPLWLTSDDRGALARRAAAAFAVVAAAYLPWVPALLSQIQNTGAPWSYTPSLRDVVRELAALFRDERVLVGLGLAAGVGLSSLVRAPRSRDARVATVLATLAVVPVVVGWALAHVEPSWATRYLAVVVAPLVLLLGMGLARAGGLGVASVVVAALLIVQPITRLDRFSLPRDAKSNADGLAGRVAARLAPGDLVVVAQPEAVPLVRSVLGPSFRYADPTGIVDDPTVMDWRDAEARLRSSSYERDVQPLVDDLAPGDRVLLVGAGNEQRTTDTEWITLFRRRGRAIVQALRADRRYTTVERVEGPAGAYVRLNGILFERVTTRSDRRFP